MEAVPARVAAGSLAVEDLARRMAREPPELADLTPAELLAVAKHAQSQRIGYDFGQKVDIARIDYQAEREVYLAQAGKVKSRHTRIAYEAALKRLEAFAARQGLAVLAMKARDAEDFAYSLATEGRAPSSVRLDLAGCSSFFTFLERRFDAIRNPFRGTKARPQQKAAKAGAYPSAEEAVTLLDVLAPEIRAAATVMLCRGLRVGALPSLTIRGKRFTARTKGKHVSGELPATALEAIKAAGLDGRRLFAGTTETKLADAMRKRAIALAQAGKLAAPYSAHDLRHQYAVTEYRKARDFYRVSKLLGYASIQVTETYLRGHGEVD